jgi:hypothetical protein
MVDGTEERCDLCIIGAGYAGVCAFNAAAKYLAPGSRVVVIDRSDRWGGTFSHAYDHVRLHQPYQQFTAGEREWAIASSKPREYLATKPEILCHFDDIVEAVVREHGIELVMLFGYEADPDHRVLADHSNPGSSVVEVDSRPMPGLAPLALPVRVTSNRLINASGFDVLPKTPLCLSPHITSPTQHRVHSLTPRDVLSPASLATLRYSRDRDKEIWVIGSGKTAVDTILALARLGPQVAARLRCVAGRGTWFLNRDLEEDNAEHFLEMLAMHAGGASGAEVMAAFAARGIMHSPIADPGSCVFGFCAGWEVEGARAALSPAAEKVVKAHLLDVVAGDPAVHGGRLSLKLRGVVAPAVPGGMCPTAAALPVTYRPIPDGSFLVNCTDNINFAKAGLFLPVVSADGLVLAPQNTCGFSGQSADLLTHAWFLGRLGDADGKPGSAIWKQLPRPTLGGGEAGSSGGHEQDKSDVWLKLLFAVIISTRMVSSVLPPEIPAQSRQISFAFPPPSEVVSRLAPGILTGCLKLWPGRWTDVCDRDAARRMDQGTRVYGGRLETQSAPEAYQSTAVARL